MKRFASHYIWIPGRGYLKQHAVETDSSGRAVRLFPLTEEIESVEWLPGVIALLSEEEAAEISGCQAEEIKNTGMFAKNLPVYSMSLADECRYPYLFYPFDFTSMQPVAGTRHRLLR